MSCAPIPTDETARLRALRKLQILDTPMEKRFDRITRSVCAHLRVPVAVLSLVDGERQWFKSTRGSHVRQTPRSIAFCAHTILEESMLVVPDALLDSRFADNPLVRGEDAVRFYAGQPIHAPDGSRIGALCAIDHKPRELSAEDRHWLEELAAEVEAELLIPPASLAQRDFLQETAYERRRMLLDSLTGVWNRDGILEVAAREMAEARRGEKPLGMALGEIDPLAGTICGMHPAEDDALRETARRLVSSIRREDSVGRIGGGRFLVIFGNCHLPQVADIAERTRIRMAATPMASPRGEVWLSMTLGVFSAAVCRANSAAEREAQLKAMLGKVEDALHHATASGRNRVSSMPAGRDCADLSGDRFVFHASAAIPRFAV